MDNNEQSKRNIQRSLDFDKFCEKHIKGFEDNIIHDFLYDFAHFFMKALSANFDLSNTFPIVEKALYEAAFDFDLNNSNLTAYKKELQARFEKVMEDVSNCYTKLSGFDEAKKLVEDYPNIKTSMDGLYCVLEGEPPYAKHRINILDHAPYITSFDKLEECYRVSRCSIFKRETGEDVDEDALKSEFYVFKQDTSLIKEDKNFIPRLEGFVESECISLVLNAMCAEQNGVGYILFRDTAKIKAKDMLSEDALRAVKEKVRRNNVHYSSYKKSDLQKKKYLMALKKMEPVCIFEKHNSDTNYVVNWFRKDGKEVLKGIDIPYGDNKTWKFWLDDKISVMEWNISDEEKESIMRQTIEYFQKKGYTYDGKIFKKEED
jgi:hypothetical protein